MPILRTKIIPRKATNFGLGISESHHASTFFMDWGAATEVTVLYVLKGQGRLETRQNFYPLKKGHVIVIQKSLVYRVNDAPKKPLSLFVLGITNPDILRLCKEVPIESARLTTHKATSHRIQKLLKELLFEQTTRRPGMELAMAALTQELLLTLFRLWSEGSASASTTETELSTSQARVAAYIRDLENDFFRPQYLEQAAAATGLHIRRFRNLFRAATGSSWLPYIRQKRINYAKRLLRETSRSVVSICFECGFEDLSNFYRYFQKMEGTSPNAWRRAHQAM